MPRLSKIRTLRRPVGEFRKGLIGEVRRAAHRGLPREEDGPRSVSPTVSRTQ